MRPRAVPALLLAAGLLSLSPPGRAQDRDAGRQTPADARAEARLAAAGEAVAQAQSALLAWAAGDPAHAPALGLDSLQPLHVERWSAADGSEAAAFAQLELSRATSQLEEARGRLLQIREELGAPPWPASPLVTETFDIRGIDAVREPPPPFLGLGAPEPPPPDPSLPSKGGCMSGAILSSKTRDTVDVLAGDPAAADATVGWSETGQLLVRLPAANVARVRQALGLVREQIRPCLSLHVRLVRLGDELRRELLAPSGGPSRAPAAQDRLARALQQGEAEVLLDRRLAAASGQVVRAYQGGELHVPADVAGVSTGEAATEARTGSIATGALVELRAARVPGGDLVDLAAHVVLVEPEGAARPARVLGSTLDLPGLAFARARGRAAIPLGASTLVLATAADADGARAEAPRTFALLVTPTLLASRPAPADPGAAEPATAEPSRASHPAGPPLPLPEAVLAIDAAIPFLDRAVAAARATTAFSLVCHPLQDLLDLGDPDAPTPLGLSGPGTRATPAPEPDSPEGDFPSERLEQWVKVLSGGESTWGEPATLQHWKGAFFVRQTPAVQARIERALALLRLGRGRTFALEASLLRVEPALLDAVEAAADEAGAGGGELPPAALARLDEGARAGRAALEVSASGLLRTGSRLSLQLGRERPFVSGFDHGKALFGVARTGFEVEASVHDDPGGGLALEADLRRVTSAGSRPQSLGPGSLECPSLDALVSTLRLVLAPGSGALVAYRRGPVGERVACWVVRVSAR